MPETYLKIVRVFIGSPGGLAEERNAAKQIVGEVNQSHAEHWGCEIKLVGWEATLPGYSRAQALINADLDKCEYFVGILWNHWGSKPDDGDTRFSSGFEEEYHRAVEHHERGRVKDIALYFKEIPEVQLNDQGPSVAKVVEFRMECIARRKPLFKDFKEPQDFGSLFRAKVEEIGWREATLGEHLAPEATEPEEQTEAEEQKALVANATNRLIGETPAAFVSDLLGRTADWEATAAFEVARLRLIATTISRSGNDDLYLGNHDANLVFAQRADLDLSAQELRALIDTAVAGFQHQNVPLWHWFARAGNDGLQRIRTLATFGNAQEKPSAIRLLQALGAGVPEFDEGFGQDFTIRDWLSRDTYSGVFDEALEFLRTNGSPENLATAESLLPDLSPASRDKLATTIVAASLKTGAADAIEKLIVLDPESPRENLASVLFQVPESIPTDQLLKCMTLRCDEIRRRAVELLARRDALTLENAEALLFDKDYEIRLAAIEYLLKQGRTLAPDHVKTVLVKSALPTLGIGLTRGGTDDSFHLRFQINRLSALRFKELKAAADAGSIFDHLKTTTLYRVYPKQSLVDIRRNLGDGFQSHFDHHLAQLSASYGAESQLVKDTRGLLDFLRKRLVLGAIEALCRLGRAQLPVIRQALDRYEVDFSETVLECLGKYGDWSDIGRILAFSGRITPGNTVLSIASDRSHRKIAAALVRVGSRRLADLLALEADPRVRSAVVVQLSKRDIGRLSDELLLMLLNDKDDNFRRVLALRCSMVLPQSRTQRLLGRYVDQDGQRYYNSIHWLDLGASMPRAQATMVAGNQLARLG